MTIIEWTLFLFIKVGYAGGPVALQTFETKEECREAFKVVEEEKYGFMRRPDALYCFPSKVEKQ